METSTIEKREVGFRWHISIDKELHQESNTRTPDKITLHGSLEGHAETYDLAVADLSQATTNLKALLREVMVE
jgi:uncharacterized protein YdeI (BOF family)